MGNTTSTNKTFDEYTKEELVLHINGMSPKKLNITNNLKIQMKDMELDNLKLIPMTIELYKKLETIVPEYKKPEDAPRQPRKKLYYLKPRFSKEQVVTIGGTDISNDDYEYYDIPNPTTPFNSNNFTIEEFNGLFEKNTGKRDFMGITKNMFEHMPAYHKQRFLNSFNDIMANNSPFEHNFSKATYIYKWAKKGDKEDIGSYRQIMAIPNSVSMLHKLMTNRIQNHLLVNRYIDDIIQKGGVSGQKNPIFQQLFKMKQIIKIANHRKDKLAIMFLDITNAFGSVNRNVLYKIMEKYHVDTKFIDYIKTYYETLSFSTKLNNESVENVKWGKGLIQGCPLSMILFVTVINYVIRYLDNKYNQSHGYKIDENNTLLFLAYVDDIAIVCRDTDKLNEVYQELAHIFKQAGFDISIPKSNIMLINHTEEEKSKYSFDNMQHVTKFKYLGQYVNIDGSCTKTYNQIIYMLGASLKRLDEKTVNVDEKYKDFCDYTLPWLERKLKVNYDLSKLQKIKIVSLLNKYVEYKWNKKHDYKLFPILDEILKVDTCDKIVMAIKNITDDECYTNKDDLNITDEMIIDISLYHTPEILNVKYGRMRKDNESEEIVENSNNNFTIDEILREIV